MDQGVLQRVKPYKNPGETSGMMLWMLINKCQQTTKMEQNPFWMVKQLLGCEESDKNDVIQWVNADKGRQAWYSGIMSNLQVEADSEESDDADPELEPVSDTEDILP